MEKGSSGDFSSNKNFTSGLWHEDLPNQRKFPNIPTRTVSYHAKLSVTDETVDRRKNNKGQPRKLSARDCRKLRKTVLNL